MVCNFNFVQLGPNLSWGFGPKVNSKLSKKSVSWYLRYLTFLEENPDIFKYIFAANLSIFGIKGYNIVDLWHSSISNEEHLEETKHLFIFLCHIVAKFSRYIVRTFLKFKIRIPDKKSLFATLDNIQTNNNTIFEQLGCDLVTISLVVFKVIMMCNVLTHNSLHPKN